jgi:hypothetical protein
MRPIILLTFVPALLLAACSAPQAPGSAPSAAAGGVHRYYLGPAEMDDIKGVYRTDNGLILRVTHAGRRLYLQLGQRPRTEMVPVAAYRFVSPDQRMTMEYRPIAFADELVVSYPADLNVASARMVTVRLAVNKT